MATVTRYVNANSSGGDGTTNATSGSNAAYASFAALVAAEELDLVANDILLQVLLEGAGNVGLIHIRSSDGWTADATRYPLVKNNTGHRHGGVWSTSFPYCSTAEEVASVYITGVNYVRLDGLQITNSITDATGEANGIKIITDDDAEIWIDNCIVPKLAANDSENDYNIGLYISEGSAANLTLKCRNNIFYGRWLSTLFNYDMKAGDVYYFYNNTVYAARNEAFYFEGNASAALHVKNNIFNGSGNDYYSATVALTSANNITTDATSPDASYRSLTPTFLDSGSGDYRLDEADTAAQDEGADLSADGNALQVDIVGTARPQNSVWDIGAFEVVASEEVTGTAALLGGASTIVGAGKPTHLGTSALESEAGIISGSGVVTTSSTGTLIAGAAVLAGAGKITHTATGAMIAGAGVVEGEGESTASAFLLDEEIYDGGDFSSTGGYFNNSGVDAGVYSTAGTNAFETPAAASIDAPPSGIEYISRIQWSLDGETDLEPNVIEANGEDGSWDLPEYYLEAEFYVPTGFPWCSGKFFRSARLISGTSPADTIHIEGGGDEEDPMSTRALAPYFATFPNADSYDGEVVTYTDWPGRDQWVTLGVWLKWNTYDGATPNADGFARMYYDGLEVYEASQENKIFSVNAAHSPGFNLIKVALNHSYTACGGTTVDAAIWRGRVRLYSTKPDEATEVEGTAALTSEAGIVAGSGKITRQGTAALTNAAASTSGAGKITHVGTSALTSEAGILEAEGEVGEDVSGEAALVSAAGSISGTGTTGLDTIQTVFKSPAVQTHIRTKLKMRDIKTGEIVEVTLRLK